MHILIAEDDGAVRDHAVRLVRGLGYVVRAAENGPEALRLLAADPRCDILFTDVMMPGMTGGQLAEAARLLVPDLPVVFATGHHADPVVLRFQREGHSVVVSKPYRRQAVAAAFRNVLGASRAS